jgi:hypothetical protein
MQYAPHGAQQHPSTHRDARIRRCKKGRRPMRRPGISTSRIAATAVPRQDNDSPPARPRGSRTRGARGDAYRRRTGRSPHGGRSAFTANDPVLRNRAVGAPQSSREIGRSHGRDRRGTIGRAAVCAWRRLGGDLASTCKFLPSTPKEANNAQARPRASEEMP